MHPQKGPLCVQRLQLLYRRLMGMGVGRVRRMRLQDLKLPNDPFVDGENELVEIVVDEILA